MGTATRPPFLPDHASPYEERTAGTDFGAPFAAVNRNKRSVCLNLKDDAHKSVFLQLCDQADAVVENMRAGRDGSAWPGLRDDRRNAIRESFTPACAGLATRGRGESPYAAWPSLDAAAQSFGGLVHANDGLVDAGTCRYFPRNADGTRRSSSAIHHARASGKGQFLDVSMYDAMLAFQKSAVAQYAFTGKPNPPGLQRAMTLYPFDLFPARDGRIAIALAQPRHWDLLCAAMERADMMVDDRCDTNAARLRNVDWVEKQICAWTRKHSRAEIMAKLDGNIPVGPVQSMNDIFRDPHVAARQMLETCDPGGGQSADYTCRKPDQVFGHPKQALYQAPPTLGAHTDEVLAEFGIDPLRHN